MLLSVGNKARNPAALQPIPGTSYGFFPTEKPTPGESAHQSTGRMLELVILAESGDCPDPSLRQADGHFHTGDLFQEVSPGNYVSRGRDDDWIKSDNGLRCDTQYVLDIRTWYRFIIDLVNLVLSRTMCEKHVPNLSKSA